MASFSKLDYRFRPWAEYLFYVAQVNGLNPILTSGYRSISSQTRLYNRWLRGAHPYPVARPGTSYHNYGRAIDLVTRNNAALGQLWETWGGKWGGARDVVHFQA